MPPEGKSRPTTPPHTHLAGVSPAEPSSPEPAEWYRDQVELGTPTPRIPALGSPRVCQVDMRVQCGDRR